LPKEQITALERAGIVHDIGKVAVPDAILLKPGKLTDEEWKIMREHPVIGERICAPLKSFRLVLPIIRHHHEKADGSGYPDGLRGDEIPMTARVLQIVDVFDALTTARPYKRALSVEETLEIMALEVAKGWWDQHVFENFSKLIAEQPSMFQKAASCG
jgi:putative two-component system response regulator